MLDIKGLSIEYGNKTAVRDFNLHLRPGEIAGIVGESGSGKTTVIRAVMGALPEAARVTAGSIALEGKLLLENTPADWRSLRGVRLSMIFQDCGGSLNPIRTIGSQFVEYIRTHTDLSKKDARDRAAEMLVKMRLADSASILRSYPHQLSGGMRQRVGIAMAMTFDPKLLLADEPTSALDVTTQAQIVRHMMELRENFGTSIILVTHNLGVACHMADSLTVMHNGIVEEQGETDAVLRHSANDYTRRLLRAIPELGGRRFV